MFVLGFEVYNMDFFECCVVNFKDVMVDMYGIDLDCLEIIGYGESCLFDIVSNVEVYCVNCCILVIVKDIVKVLEEK